MAVLWLDDIGSDDLETVGGKGASLGELTGAGLPVPPAFVVTAGTYREFIENAGIDEALDALDRAPDSTGRFAVAGGAEIELTAEAVVVRKPG